MYGLPEGTTDSTIAVVFHHQKGKSRNTLNVKHNNLICASRMLCRHKRLVTILQTGEHETLHTTSEIPKAPVIGALMYVIMHQLYQMLNTDWFNGYLHMMYHKISLRQLKCKLTYICRNALTPPPPPPHTHSLYSGTPTEIPQ